jgi:predicted nucleic acid-binding protein
MNALTHSRSRSRNARATGQISSRSEAIAQVEAWLEAPTLTLLAETTGHWSELRDVLVSARVAGPRVYDARIAALCRQHGVERLWSADRDFSRFAGVRVTNPLVGE